MIYNGQRINKVNIYKVKGSKDYILADESNILIEQNGL